MTPSLGKLKLQDFLQLKLTILGAQRGGVFCFPPVLALHGSLALALVLLGKLGTSDKQLSLCRAWSWSLSLSDSILVWLAGPHAEAQAKP